MITVIGSINMDLAVVMDLFPQQGETVLGTEFATIPGGKGANQAIACAKLGSEVQFIGCVGDDQFGKQLTANLHDFNIETTGIQTVNVPTGIANILVHNNDNRIVVIPGANSKITKKQIDENWSLIEKSKLVIMQLEIPKDVVTYVIDKCYESNIQILLNPAPAQHFSTQWIDKLTYMTPNESECQQIFQLPYDQVVAMYPNKVIVTLGDKGACYHDGQKLIEVVGYKAQVIDTTGAGDTFNGALAYALTNKSSLDDAVYFANIAASLSIEKFGAQGGMPTLEAVLERGNLNNR